MSHIDKNTQVDDFQTGGWIYIKLEGQDNGQPKMLCRKGKARSKDAKSCLIERAESGRSQ